MTKLIDDNIGKKFGRLTIVEKSQLRNKVRCLCDCGNEKDIKIWNITSGVTVSCGCYGNERRVAANSKNISGKRFGRLVAEDIVDRNANRGVLWRCKCDCGNTVNVFANSLMCGNTRSCGCLLKDATRNLPKNSENLIGRSFGRLSVISGPYYDEITRCRMWECMCACGNVITRSTGTLKSGHVLSCGCYNRDRVRECNTTHGMSNTPEYDRALARSRREREKRLDVAWSLEMECAIFEFFSECVLCESVEKLSVDHVYPISMGYGLEPGNATVLCMKCNSRKNRSDPNSLDERTRDILFSTAEQFRSQWMD